jgi:ribonuclease HI
MTSNVIFLRKARSTRSTWDYMSSNDKGQMVVSDGDLAMQMGMVIEKLVAHGDTVTVVSPQLNSRTREDLAVLFPNMHFMPITETSINGFFERSFSQTVSRRRANQNVKFCASDASGGHIDARTNEMVPAVWAWCSDGVNGSYDFGYSGDVNVNVSEFEGIANAIVANADDPAARIHIFSDSANAVDMFNYDVAEGIIPREARKYGLVGIAKDAMEVMKARPVTVEWVKGHRQHRLNNIADSISRHARVRFMAGFVADDFVRETDALYAVFNRNA